MSHFLTIKQGHATDLIQLFGTGGDIQDFTIRFVNNLNPNGPPGTANPNWPTFSLAHPQMMEILDGTPSLNVSTDTARLAPILDLIALSAQSPL